MRMKWCVAAALLSATIAVPVSSAIKAMNLEELMSITNDVVSGTILDKDSIELDHPGDGAVYTRLTVKGESLRTGKKGTWELVFHGSHDPADRYIMSEMPTLQDSRVGGEIVVFFEVDKKLDDRNHAHSWANLYRVEKGFGEPVVIGKGEGAAFEKNTRLVDVRERVATTHAALLKKQAGTPDDNQGK